MVAIVAVKVGSIITGKTVLLFKRYVNLTLVRIVIVVPFVTNSYTISSSISILFISFDLVLGLGTEFISRREESVWCEALFLSLFLLSKIDGAS